MAFQLLSLILIVKAFYSGVCTDINDITTSGVYTFFGDKVVPSFVSLNVTLNGTLLCMNLERNADMTHDIPLYALSKDSKGRYHTQKVQMDKNKVFAVYIDNSKLAAFRIVHKLDKNGKSRMHLEGIVYSNGKLYHVKNANQLKTMNEEDQKSTKEKITKRTEKEYTNKEVFFIREVDRISTMQNDALLKAVEKPTLDKIFEDTSPHLHQKRQVTQDVNIDVVAVVDFAVYSRWYKYSTPSSATESQEQSTLDEIRQFYVLVFNGVNMLYKSLTDLPYIIHVRLSRIVVSTNSRNSYWTEQYRQRDAPWDKVDAYLALNSFSEWAPPSNSLLYYDHIVLFTGLNMTSTVNNKTSDIAGLAWIGKVCETDGYSSSLVEDLGGFQVIGIATHEIGHSLSAQHDGTRNSCKADDRYIMSPGDSNRTEENMLNPWRFSSCSPDYFDTYIARQVRTEKGRQCMYGVIATLTSLPNVTSPLPGQVYNATEQCRQRYGPQSYVCQTKWKASDVCTQMYCHKPGDSLKCYYLDTAQGTLCGNKKWCVDGLCTYSDEAPAIDDCIYGDRELNCNKSLCYGYIYMEKCCRTCNYSQFTAPQNASSQQPGQLFNVNEQCIQAYGPGSYLCPDIIGWNASKMCSAMYCHNPRGDAALCYEIAAAEGTTCGNKQWCVKGHCLYDNNAPEIDDDCILGDNLNALALYGQTCSLVRSDSSYCSHPFYREHCCQTCANLLTSSLVKSTTPSARTTLFTSTMTITSSTKTTTAIKPTTITTKTTTSTKPTAITTKTTTATKPTTITTKTTTDTKPTTITTKTTTATKPTTITTKTTTATKPTTITTKTTTDTKPTTITTKTTTDTKPTTITTKTTTDTKPTTITTKTTTATKPTTITTKTTTATKPTTITTKTTTDTKPTTITTKTTTDTKPTTITTKTTTDTKPTTITTKTTTATKPTTITTKTTTDTKPTTITTKTTTATKPTTITTKTITDTNPTTVTNTPTTHMSTSTIITKKETIFTVGPTTTKSTAFQATLTAKPTQATASKASNFGGRLENLTCSRFIVLIAVLVAFNCL